MKIEIINPITQQPYPSTVASGRTFFLVEAGQEFYVRVSSGRYGRQEYVVAVDGRDTLTNEDATLERSGIIVSDSTPYLCKGFRVSASDVRTFTAVHLGQGATTAERNGTANMAGLVFAACYSEQSRIPARNPAVYDGGGVTRGGDRMPRKSSSERYSGHGEPPIMGDVVRVDGHAGGERPVEGWVSLDSDGREVVVDSDRSQRKEVDSLAARHPLIAKLAEKYRWVDTKDEAERLTVARFIGSYHIDTEEGLAAFIEIARMTTPPECYLKWCQRERAT